MAKPEGAGRSEEADRAPAHLTNLVAVTGADGNPLAALRTAAAEYGGASLGLHASAEAVGLHAAVTVRLKCALGHLIALLILLENLCLDGKS
jgi:hypothetical protein